MNKYIFYAVILVLVLPWGCTKKEKAGVKIGSIEITAGEFERGFKDSRFSSDPSGRQGYLKELIRKKLILHEAQKMGLDKDPDFLKDIEFYWEQGLLKLALARKSKELMSNAQVTDKEIQDYYEAHRNTDFSGSELSQVHQQIRWLILQEKQTQALDQWISDLEQRIPIQVDDSLISGEK